MKNDNTTIQVYDLKETTSFAVPVILRYDTTKTGMSESEKLELINDALRNDLSTIGQFVQGIGYDLTMDNVEGIKVGPMVELFGNMVRGVSEALEIAEMEWKDKTTKPDKSTADKSTPLDLSGSAVESLSMKLSDILTNPLLPEKLRERLSDEIGFNFSADTADPEVIRKSLENSLKREDDNE